MPVSLSQCLSSRCGCISATFSWHRTCPDAGKPSARSEMAASVRHGCREAGCGLVVWKSLVLVQLYISFSIMSDHQQSPPLAWSTGGHSGWTAFNTSFSSKLSNSKATKNTERSNQPTYKTQSRSLLFALQMCISPNIVVLASSRKDDPWNPKLKVFSWEKNNKNLFVWAAYMHLE